MQNCALKASLKKQSHYLTQQLFLSFLGEKFFFSLINSISENIEKQRFSRVLRDSTPRFVGPSVRPSITFYFFGVFAVFDLTAPVQMIK